MPFSNSGSVDKTLLASTESRFRAGLVDGLIYIVLFVGALPLANQWGAKFDFPELSIPVFILLVLCFEPFVVTLLGGTIGHRIYGLKVVDEFGQRVGFSRALKRWVLKAVYGTRTYDPIRNGNGLAAAHDNATHSFVIYAR